MKPPESICVKDDIQYYAYLWNSTPGLSKWKKKSSFFLAFLSLYPNKFLLLLLYPEDKDRIPPFSENGLSYTGIMVRLMIRKRNREGETLKPSEFYLKYFTQFVMTRYMEELCVACLWRLPVSTFRWISAHEFRMDKGFFSNFQQEIRFHTFQNSFFLDEQEYKIFSRLVCFQDLANFELLSSNCMALHYSVSCLLDPNTCTPRTVCPSCHPRRPLGTF